LEIARAFGARQFVARSGLGVPFVCHMGDFFGENPFYNRRLSAPELRLAQAWLRTQTRPVVIDVGANVGYWSTQLAQLLGPQQPVIYSFEPAPDTYCRLVKSVEALDLEAAVFPIGAAVSSSHSIVSLSFNPKDSGYAQVGDGALNKRAGDRIAKVVAVTLDRFVADLELQPDLVKIDVEGGEIRVLRGAAAMLSSARKPALSFELFPQALAETGSDRSAFPILLEGYEFYYIDDFEGQRRKFGSRVEDLNAVDWTCNLFAIPIGDHFRARFASAAEDARSMLSGA
jgi:FkbM family methyltransferase